MDRVLFFTFRDIVNIITGRWTFMKMKEVVELDSAGLTASFVARRFLVISDHNFELD